MKRFYSVAVLLLACFMEANLGHAAILHESATFGPGGQTPSLDIADYLGSRFLLTNSVQVESVGGHILNGGFDVNNQLFAAIVPLTSIASLPAEGPLDFAPLAVTNLIIPSMGAGDFLAPLSVRLEPGAYALILGSGRFGATHFAGGMKDGNFDIPGQASYFSANLTISDQWQEYSGHGLRFIVTGRVIPEPQSIILIGLAIFSLRDFVGCRRTRIA